MIYINDKVACYFEYDGEVRIVGTVTAISGNLVTLKIVDDSADGSIYGTGAESKFHIKQCRKIKPAKTPRECWVKFNEHGKSVDTATFLSELYGDSWVKMRETKKFRS